MNTATTSISTARDIARSAERQITATTGMRMTLMLCPADETNKGPEHMMAIIAATMNMHMFHYQERGRRREIVELRFVAARLLRAYYPAITLKQVALLFGGQDHTSVINALAKAGNLLDTNDLIFTRKYSNALCAVDLWLKAA
jgi:chromosomal replication initiation ATPase DnaA